jgi:CDP-6-deoxy-D-xylo-4-hexulose-3-dehydrase
MTTTSCYFAHQIQAVEFGFLFVANEDDEHKARMFRNHGMTRSVPAGSAIRRGFERDHWSVDPLFLFAYQGTNLRPSNINAAFGLKDFERIDEAEAHRQRLFKRFRDKKWGGGYYFPPIQPNQSMFCLPIFYTCDRPDLLKKKLNDLGIETRPIVGANLLRQPAFKNHGNAADFPNAEWLHYRGMYIGLHQDVTERMIDDLAEVLMGHIK